MNSNLSVRAASAVIMVAVAGLAIWAGGAALTALVFVVGSIAFYEWVVLARKIPTNTMVCITVIGFGALYIGLACLSLIVFRRFGLATALLPIVATVATDVGAYFTGRLVGGPKIAPSISPSKTWSGLFGGMIAAAIGVAIVMAAGFDAGGWSIASIMLSLILGAAFAIIAQVGDFGESLMKRRAGVKDSGTLIPGHGGVLDRIDGLLAVLVAYSAIYVPFSLFGDWG